MSGNNQDPPVAQMSEQQQAALRQLAQDTKTLVEVGRETYGAGSFDDACVEFTSACGDRQTEAVHVLMQFDRPHEIIAHLANNPDWLKQFAKLPTHRQVIEAGRIEAQLSSHGHVETVADPM